MGRGFLQTVDALLSRRRVQLLLKPCKTLPQSLLSASAAVFLNRCAASFAKRPLPLESVRAISGMIGAAGLQASRSAMSFYRDRVYPHIVAAMGNPEPIQKIRQQVVPHAQGIVLEIGVGPGVNFPLYDPAKVKKLYALEPNRGMVQRADIQGRRTKLDLEFLDLPGEKIPLPDASVDTVVSTFTLCTIPGVADAIRGIARVLRPGGQFLFFEHALFWENGTASDLGNLGGDLGNIALGINNLGQAVGGSDIAGDLTSHAFLWSRNTGMKDLGTLGEDSSALPSGSTMADRWSVSPPTNPSTFALLLVPTVSCTTSMR